MRKFITLIVAIMFIINFTGLKCYANNSFLIEKGINIPVTSKEQCNSKNITSGTKLECLIMEDVVVNNKIIFKRGGKATLNVINVKKARYIGIPGEITIDGGEVYDINNNPHIVDIQQKISGTSKTWPKICVGCGVFIILAPLVLFGFVKGGQAEVIVDKKMETTLNQDFVFKKE